MSFANECGVRLNLRRMDRLVVVAMLLLEAGVPREETPPGTTIRESAMTRSMQASLTAIGRQLHDGYLPTLAQPLPSDLKDLVARLVALEINKRGSSKRAIAVLQSAAAHPESKA